PKSWTPRAAKTLTSAEFPGTVVLWEERYFEVVDAEALPQGGVQYVLEPWREVHIMRITDRYDAESEAERLIKYRAQLSRETKRKSVNVMALLTGHLPASVQEELGRELGVRGTRLTMISALGIYAIVVGLVLWLVTGFMAGIPRPLPAFILTGYLFIESSFRFIVAGIGGRPSGSAAGVFGYILYYFTIADRRRAVTPFAREKGMTVTISETPEERAVSDALLLREPLVTLLNPADQARVAERFGYDYRHQSSRIATLILVFALIGVASSICRGAVISFTVASAISAEQIYRLLLLRRQPVGSFLGIVARPFVRKLL
ncbi:MAG: hypothetical protein ACRD3J_21920, partial [Thermoanaerobaculia bacterium]